MSHCRAGLVAHMHSAPVASAPASPRSPTATMTPPTVGAGLWGQAGWQGVQGCIRFPSGCIKSRLHFTCSELLFIACWCLQAVRHKPPLQTTAGKPPSLQELGCYEFIFGLACTHPYSAFAWLSVYPKSLPLGFPSARHAVALLALLAVPKWCICILYLPCFSHHAVLAAASVPASRPALLSAAAMPAHAVSWLVAPSARVTSLRSCALLSSRGPACRLPTAMRTAGGTIPGRALIG